MLNGFEESIKDIEMSDEVRAAMIKNANTLSAGLSDKNAELISKNKLIHDQTDSQKALAEAEAEELKNLRSFKSTSELEVEEAGKNYTTAKELLEKSHETALANLTETGSKALEEAQKVSSAFESQLKVIKVSEAITKELVALDVAKELMPMAQVSIESLATFVDGKAMIGDKSLSDYMKEWADSPAGKASRLAPNNTGGDADTGDNNSSSKNSKEAKTSDERAAEINERFKKL